MTQRLHPDRESERVEGLHGAQDPAPEGWQRYEIHVDAPGVADGVLARSREVMRAIIEATPSAPEGSLGEVDLPAWFVSACGPELTQEEARAQLDSLAELSSDAYDAEMNNAAWSVEGFLYWFEPENREWWWWGADLLDEDHLVVCLVSREYSFPREALVWLFRAAGAQTVVDEDMRALSERDDFA